MNGPVCAVWPPARAPRRWPASARLAAIVGALALLGARAAGAAPPTLNGHVEYETFGYPDSEAQADRWENFFAATVRGRGDIAPTLSWQFEGRAVADDAQFTAGAWSVRNEGRQRPYLSLITALLDYRPLPEVRLTVGTQSLNWSVFDAIGPANVITPADQSDAFRRIEQGVPSVAVRYGIDSTFAELVVVPLAFTPSRLPQHRWDIIQGDDIIEPQDMPPVQFDETQAAARIGTRLGALDVCLLGYVGRDADAIFVPGPLILTGIVNGSPQFKAQIIDTYSQLRTGGLNASYPVGDRVLLRTEAVYYNSPDRNHDDFVHTAAGIEYALDDWRIVLNYLRDDNAIAAPEEVTNKGERRFFQSFIFGETRYDAGGRLRGRVRGGYDINGEFALAEPELSYRVWQRLWVTLLGNVTGVGRASYTSNKTSYFTSIRHEDRLGTRIEYDF